MQSDVCNVIAVGPLTIDRGVEHQRKPGQGDPIGVVELQNGPFQARPSQSVEHIAIPLHVGRIVEDDEIEAADLSVDGQRQHNQQRTEHKIPAQKAVAAPTPNKLCRSVRDRHRYRNMLVGFIERLHPYDGGPAFAEETEGQSQAGT